LDETITFWNAGAERLYGYTKEEALGQKINILLKAKNSKSFNGVITQLKQGKNWTGEITNYAKNNNKVIVQSYWSATLDAQGGIVEILESNVDITEHKKAEEALHESQQKFKALFSANPDAAVFLDTDFHVVEANFRFSVLFGYSVDEIKGKIVTDLIVPDDSKEESRSVRQKILAGSVEIVTARRRKDGSLIPVFMSGGPVFVNGKVIGCVIVYKDISDIITVQEELTKALDKAELLNEKLRVVGSLTRHDVRNKLSAVTGYAYILKKKHSDQADIVDGLGKVEQVVKETVRIFDFAKMYEQLGEEELTYIDVEEKLKDAAALFSGPTPTIMNECQGLTVLADSFLRQLFFNFIDNTRKYGKKTTTIRVYFERADQGSLKLVYEDDGVGVPSENKPRLFSEGFSTEGSTGFGLFLTKKMMDVYDWQIQENGTPGQGAKFTITIPKLNKNGKENYQIVS
jgi:PAS domain S-box-containing protein